MPNAKIQFVYDKKNASSFGNKKGTVFVKGDLPELFRGIREYDGKITLDAVSRYHCGAVLIGGSDKQKISTMVDKEKNRSCVICFSGKKSDYEAIREKYKGHSSCLVLRMAMGVRYTVDFRWGSDHCQMDLLEEEKFVDKPITKEVKKNVDVGVQKSNNDTKANK